MPRKRTADCMRSINRMVKDGQLSKRQADELLARVDRLATARAKKNNIKLEDALKAVEGEILLSLKFEQRIQHRNKLLTIAAKRRVEKYIADFEKAGEGLQAFLEGSNKSQKGARLSLDYKARSMYHQYFGSFIAEIQQGGLMRDFRSGKIDREIYTEVAELNKQGGQPGKSGNESAKKIAAAYDRVRKEMVARQNAAGAYIRNLDGYIMRQTHDTTEIQKLGKDANGKLDKDLSFQRWSHMVLPLLDQTKTFNGAAPMDFLKKVHENIHSGVHGHPADEAEVAEFFAHGSLARSASAHRVLHFKDAESAFQYNQMFGTKNFSDGILSDYVFRSRNIALMESLGPNPHNTWLQIVQAERIKARSKKDAAAQIKRIDDWRLDAAWAEVSGANEYPQSISLSKIGAAIRTVTQMSKMGGVVLSSLGDKAFIQSEMAFQGMGAMDTFTKQMLRMVGRSKDQKQTLHLMGIGLDSMIGHTLSRYSIHSGTSNKLHRMQQKFFDLNFMNWWNDTHKSVAGELMAAHLGVHSKTKFDDLPPELANVLKLYDIGDLEWRALSYSTDKAPNGELYTTPQSLMNIPDSLLDTIAHQRHGWNPSPQARTRVRNEIEEKLRVYFTDRIDLAVPTPGAGERKFMTFGSVAGTPLGETIRMLAMFKSFPVTVTRKIVGREIYGRGANTARDWLAHDHKGKFALAQLIAMTTIGGYLAGSVKEVFKGRKPKPLLHEGEIQWRTVNDAFLRGGGAGIMGDFLFTEYDRSYSSFMGVAAGPVIGQLDPLSSAFAKTIRGENPTKDISKLILSNTPFINLFYIRPILDYFIVWNIQEMVSPGYIDRMSSRIEEENKQEFIIDPRDAIR